MVALIAAGSARINRCRRFPLAEQGFFKRRPRPSKDMVFDYKDVEMLSQFTTPGGKIVAARVSRLNAKQQRACARAVKRARQLALLPNGAF
jgi:small subunit ribosomal protein S18